MERRYLTAGLLIIGGGTAGCYAAITAARRDPALHILLAEKANIRRSGCLAAGVNALNAYLTPGQTARDYLEFVRADAGGIIRDDLVLSMAEGFNAAAEDLERMGLVILKDAEGRYAARGKRNIKINGENIKPLLAAEVRRYANITVLNHVNITELLTSGGRVAGAAGFSVREAAATVIAAPGVILATGGASGLYRPNNPGFSRHKMWYPPFNTGAGYAMGIRAGAEMTTLEMRFVALRCKDTVAPTGTLALGAGAREINALGEVYEERYGLTTSQRAYGAAQEKWEGRGPCYLRTKGISPAQEEELLRAYLNMAPAQTLRWVESGSLPSRENVEVEGTEPYIVGGHTASGCWVDTRRRTTLPGLYAAGDVAGGAPMKFVTGALAEGRLAAEAFLDDREDLPDPSPEELRQKGEAVIREYETYLSPAEESIPCVFELEERMQRLMDEYAGGIGAAYRYSESRLRAAAEGVAALAALSRELRAEDAEELRRIYELRDRLTVCRSLLAHLEARRESRWPGFGIFEDYPETDEGQEHYVNSVWEDGTLRILRRPLVKEARYEHTH